MRPLLGVVSVMERDFALILVIVETSSSLPASPNLDLARTSDAQTWWIATCKRESWLRGNILTPKMYSIAGLIHVNELSRDSGGGRSSIWDSSHMAAMAVDMARS